MPRHDNVPLRRLLHKLEIDRVDFVGAGANGESDIVLFKRHKTQTTKTQTVPPSKGDDMTKEEHEAAVAKAVEEALAKQTADHEAAVAKAVEEALAAAKGDPDPDEVIKGLSPEAAEAFAKERAEREALAKQVAEMSEREAERIFKAKAETLAHVGGGDDVAQVLKSVASGSPDAYEAVEKLLTTAEERLAKSGLLTHSGSGQTIDKTDDPASALVAKADELQAADPNLGRADAIAKAAQLDPAGYTAYRKSLR